MRRMMAIGLFLIMVLSFAGCAGTNDTVQGNLAGRSEEVENDPWLKMPDGPGAYTLEECQESPGLYVRYPDGTFDDYGCGHAEYWDGEEMPYGWDGYPLNLIIKASYVRINRSNLERGELVLFWPYEGGRYDGLYKVKESGYTLFRKNEDGDLEGLFYPGDQSDGTEFITWKGSVLGEPLDYVTIDGVHKDDYKDFPVIDGRKYGSFLQDETYTIGIADGTTLIETEYKSNYLYLIHEDEPSDFKLIPTVDGYATFDFSDTEPGRYVFIQSFWSEERECRGAMCTCIDIE